MKSEHCRTSLALDFTALPHWVMLDTYLKAANAGVRTKLCPIDGEMSRTVDLGRCLFYASDSDLQLCFSAIAQFTHSSNSGDIKIPIEAIQWPNSLSAWVTEAPELEIRLSIGVPTCLKITTSTLICSLSERLCSSKIWSDLGFAIVLKEHGDNEIAFGLCRIPTTSNLTKGRALPNMLRNPPDAHAPPGVPTISLAAINIYAEYQYPQGERISHNPSFSYVGQTSQPQCLFSSAECYYQMRPGNPEEAAWSLLPYEPGASSFRDHILLLDHGVGWPSLQHDSLDNSSETMLRFIDFGLRKLIISSTARDRQIKVDGDNTLASLSDLAPAIFDPDYREAVHQRAASIPIISKAMASMLASCRSPMMQRKLSYLLQQSNHSNEGHALIEPYIPSLRSTIHSYLWRIAQQRTRRRKETKEIQPILSQEPPVPRSYPDALPSLANFGEFTLPHSDPLDLENPNLKSFEQDHMEYFLGDENLLLKTPSESSFKTLDESTPATQNDSFEWFEPCFSKHRDTDMLFLDHDV